MQIKNDEVHVWCARLDDFAPEQEPLFQVLSADEKTRAERFHFARDRKRYIIRRGILRTMLSSYLGIKAGQVRIHSGKHGKPVLAGWEKIHFNLSCSAGVALYAFTRGSGVGVDIERLREVPEMKQIVDRFFSVKEKEYFSSLSESERKEAFFRLWTRKEAYVKGVGHGLQEPLVRFDALPAPGETSGRVIAESAAEEQTAGWNIHDLAPSAGFTAACAVQGEDNVRLNHFFRRPEA
jgi:4'-phosphopantetheinyl transferase